MLTIEEIREDGEAEAATATREDHVEEMRRRLSHRATLIRKRGQRLRDKLQALDPGSDATAELTGALEDNAEDAQWIQYGIYQLTADALATATEDGLDYTYTAADIKAWCERADEMGAAHPQIRAEHLKDIVRMRIVPNAPFRLRYVESETSDRDLALLAHRHLAYLEEQDGADYGSKHFVMDGNPQARQCERVLGLSLVGNGAKTLSLRLFIPYEVGVAFMRTLNMTPQQAGL